MRTLFAVLVCLGLGATALADPDNFKVEIRPVFESATTWQGAPVAVNIENRGPDAQGQLLVGSEGQTTRYPVELPTGSKKRIIAIPRGGRYGMEPEFVMDTNQGRFVVPYLNKATPNYGNISVIALISDNPGDLGFLKQEGKDPNEVQNSYADAYCKPEDAPERPVAFQGVAAVVLGSGSERLSDGAVKALHSYVMTGGVVIFIGGASATTLTDARWANMLPVTDFKTATVSRSTVLNYSMGDSITISSGKPITSARTRKDGNVTMIAERGFGLGRAILFAFNPFEEPLVRWQGRKRLFTQLVRPFDAQRVGAFMGQFDSTQNQDPYYGGGYGYPTSSYSYGSGVYYEGNGRRDPFSVQLPGPSKVFWTLAAFFVVVVPLNFLVLRKLGRGELAWLTAPVISLVFAGVFLNQASDLYAASLSTATRGAIIAQAGAPEGLFVGSTQMFFPSGGSYDLKLENVDQLGTGTDYEYGFGREQNRLQIDPIDTGSIRVPDLRAANLAFEEIGYRQRLEKFPGLQVRSSRKSGTSMTVEVKNLGSSSLDNVAVIVGGRRYGLESIPAGGTQEVDVSTDFMTPDDGNAYLESVTSRQRMVFVVADIQGLRPGPQLGQNVANRSSIRLVYSAPLNLGGGSF